ncbi:hypothetical protein [uncultured Methanobrevibacter sp.]|uniref:hypothetical protein n=1 Tax=uncultured Methanobrevibacter sp. TaxID=253161 RepID=UPI0025E2F131|nr:hypothetical protein [uncultured Methanobrevibacter sp.]
MNNFTINKWANFKALEEAIKELKANNLIYGVNLTDKEILNINNKRINQIEYTEE